MTQYDARALIQVIRWIAAELDTEYSDPHEQWASIRLLCRTVLEEVDA